MGACLSNEKLPENIFIVRNINDDHHRFPKGVIEVTATDLKYKDIKSGDEWVWPLKYLRKYGCDREIFSFEAGRKCPGGEGLYAFSTKKASELFDMVARNISEGGLLLETEAGALSPPNGNHASSHSPVSLVPPPVPESNPPPIPASNPPPVPASNPPSHPPANRQPKYQNMSYQNGQPVIGDEASGAARRSSSSPPAPSIPNDRRPSKTSTTNTPSPPPVPVPSVPPRINYTEITLPEPSDPSPPEEGKDPEKRVSYTQIDIRQTEEYNRQLQKTQAENTHPIPDLSRASFTTVTSAEREKSSKRNGRPRMPTYPSSSSSHRSTSDSSINSPNSLSDSARDVHLKANGAIHSGKPHHSHSFTCGVTEPTALYQNLSLSASKNVTPQIPELPEQQQVNYINITPQPSLSRKTSDQSQQLQMYENLHIQKAVSPPLSAVSLASSPPRLVSGEPMGTYADLVLPNNTSTPKGRRDSDKDSRHREDNHHVLLSFSTPPPSAVNKTPAPKESSAVSPPMMAEITATLSTAGEPSNHPKPVSGKDETVVNYATMNFEYMEALRKTKEERDEEKRRRGEEEREEEERRRKAEEEKEAKLQKKKDKKNKKNKDRRNSHN